MAQERLEAAIRVVGRQLYRDAGKRPPELFASGGLRGRVLAQALKDQRLRSALFQFIDVLPQLADARDIALHFHSYLEGQTLPGVWGKLLNFGKHPWAAAVVRASVKRTARLFLVEEEPGAVLRVAQRLKRRGSELALDATGEAVLTEAEADRYAARYLKLIRMCAASGILPHVSLKLSAMTPRFDPLDPVGTRARVLARALPLLVELEQTGGALTIDMEQFEFKTLVLQLFRELAQRSSGRWQPGIALQAYLPDTESDIQQLAGWARGLGRRIGVRLVKGAYWDTEIALAAQRRWAAPVFEDKTRTDANFERLTRVLFEQRDVVLPAIATHNLRSAAHAIALAAGLGMKPQELEIQMLYGMAEPLQHAVAAQGVRLRVYVPCGDLVIGIAYLIRRLMENTASTSILRQTYAEGADPDALLADPLPNASAAPPVPAATTPFTDTPLTDFSRADMCKKFELALVHVRGEVGRDYRLAIPGATASIHDRYDAINPARPEEVLGHIELAGAEHVAQAVRNAARAFPMWRDTPPARRCELSLRAADLLLEQRFELAAWEVLEQGKNWREADADVAEAIDYLRYYAQQMALLAGWQPTVCFPGEGNHLCYEPRGVAAIIAPWNFPLAILAGMTMAALVSGNCAIMKPAASAQIVAYRFMKVLHAAGFPPGVCQLLPGRGSTVGDVLVEHPQVDVIAFTGSREVGLGILEKAARLATGQTHVKRVVCEMGGKNAIIVDADADLDDAVAGIVQSAFGYQGQKCSACSRVIALAPIHDRLAARLAAALSAYAYGPPEDPQFVFGPVITRAAQEKARSYIELGQREGRLYYQGAVPADGFYVAPTIFTGIHPQHRLAREEIFAPVLAVLRAENFEHALAMALDSDYALTGGVYSRLPQHLQRARACLRVGNLYLNRRITGALVAAQPFGGVKLSGTGIQAGGPDYLKQFMWTRVVSENTMRHGLVT